MISAAVLLCSAVLGLEYLANYVHVRSSPHHWYAVDLYVPYYGRRTDLTIGNRGIRVVGARGPYDSKTACNAQLKRQTVEYGQWACREMTDKNAASLQGVNGN